MPGTAYTFPKKDAKYRKMNKIQRIYTSKVAKGLKILCRIKKLFLYIRKEYKKSKIGDLIEDMGSFSSKKDGFKHKLDGHYN